MRVIPNFNPKHGAFPSWDEASPELRAEFVAWIEAAQRRENEEYERRKQSPSEFRLWLGIRAGMAFGERLQTEFGLPEDIAEVIVNELWPVYTKRMTIDGKPLHKEAP